MKTKIFVVFGVLVFSSCKKDIEKIHPVKQSITESVYASGIIKAGSQYQAFATASGIVDKLLVKEGDTVKKGQAILTIVNQTQLLNKENAALAAEFSNLSANAGKLADAKQQVALAFEKLKVDSALYVRQKNLWQQQVGSKIDLEQKELNYKMSQTNYFSAQVRKSDLERQLALNAGQSSRQLAISERLLEDYTLKSELDGIVYDLFKERGEVVSPQTPLAIIGEAGHYILSMQVDEYDIFRIQTGMMVLITMDSHQGMVYKARITKLYPIMNERSKSFVVEAEFTDAAPKLFPNVSFEANIIVSKKENALLIPRNCLINDSTILLEDGTERVIKTGLKDFKMIEVLSGLTDNDIIQRPKK